MREGRGGVFSIGCSVIVVAVTRAANPVKMKVSVVVLLSLVGLVMPAAIDKTPVVDMNEDATLTVPELILKYGYPCEVHSVTTPDGYVLTLHRIPHGRSNIKPKNKSVFIQHGLLSSSADWIIAGVKRGLGYILADEGYDVWMGNARGNHFSRNHTTLNPDVDHAFWDFSWHEIGLIDLPTMIDYVLKTTGEKDTLYVGHSQGTTSFFVMLSSLPEYNAKIRAHVSLAPIAYMSHMTSPLVHIMAFWQKSLSILLNLIGMYEFLPNYGFMALAGDKICGDGEISQFLCTNSLFALCGFSEREMNATLLPILMGHTPAGSATKQVLHYAQEVNSGRFRQYDYGMFGNLDKYGRIFPPDYELKKITAPVYLVYSHNDWLAGEADVSKLCDSMPGCKGKFLTSDDDFNHLDYLFGIDAPKLAYNKVISIFARH